MSRQGHIPFEVALAAPKSWHPCPNEVGCSHCGAEEGTRSAHHCDWNFAEAVYCISLASRPDRAAAAAAQLHRSGLCRKATFYRPTLHRNPKVGIWQSHRAVALDALRRGFRKILVLEDDALFARDVDRRTVRQVGEAIASLPESWTIFFLGHWPLSDWLVRRNVLRTRSGRAHAYIAGRRLLGWLAANEYGSLPLVRWAGSGIDAAYAALPGTYALFPMLATQRASRSDHIRSDRRKPIRKLKHLATRSRHRELLLANLMRPAEWLTVVLSPLFYMLDRTGIGPTIQAPAAKAGSRSCTPAPRPDRSGIRPP